MRLTRAKVLAIPGMKDLVDGRIHIGVLKKISAADLLGREPVEPMAELMARDIEGKTVMVTGAGGSIGSELCRQIVGRVRRSWYCSNCPNIRSTPSNENCRIWRGGRAAILKFCRFWVLCRTKAV